MNNLITKFSFCIVCLAITGCTTTSLQITSQPESAEVTLISKEKMPVKIGKTPVSVDSQKFPQILRENFEIQAVKSGFSSQSVVIPKLSQMGADGKINFNLESLPLPEFCQSQEKSLSEIARGVAEVSNLMQSKKLGEANILVQILMSKFETVSVLHDIQGNIFFLQKNFSKALESYKKSNELDPSNTATQRMIKKIEQLQGQGT